MGTVPSSFRKEKVRGRGIQRQSQEGWSPFFTIAKVLGRVNSLRQELDIIVMNDAFERPVCLLATSREQGVARLRWSLFETQQFEVLWFVKRRSVHSTFRPYALCTDDKFADTCFRTKGVQGSAHFKRVNWVNQSDSCAAVVPASGILSVLYSFLSLQWTCVLLNSVG